MSDANPAEPQPPREWVWTLSQRRAILGLLCVMGVVLWVQFFRNRQFVPDPQPAQGPRSAELASRIDPNTADWHELAAIPNLGEKRAQDIVAYRDRLRMTNPNRVVFKSLTDLRGIRDIGPATAERLRTYLIFPGESPAQLPPSSDAIDPPR